MKIFLEKYIYIAGILAIISLAAPFINMKSVVYEEEIGKDNFTATYNELSVTDTLIEATVSLYRGGATPLAVNIFTSLYFFVAIVLVQFFASLYKRYKIMYYTALVLFTLAFILFLFLYTKVNYITVMYGYYVFLVLQILLILFSYKPTTYAKDTTY